MKAEFTGVKIKLGGEEKIISPKQAEELRDALTELLGPKKPVTDAVDYFCQQFNSSRKSEWQPPINAPQPYNPLLDKWPGKRPDVWCGSGTTGVIGLHQTQ